MWMSRWNFSTTQSLLQSNFRVLVARHCRRGFRSMFTGTVVSIHIAPASEAEMQAVDEVRADPGQGLEGDRYFKQTGTFAKAQPDRELTLIEAEAIEAMHNEMGVALASGASRRNIVTRDVPLNHLVGREF